MVRKGSPVRVRQRALRNPLETAGFVYFDGFFSTCQEAASALHDGHTSRPVLQHYSLPFLDQMVAMVTAATLMSYAIYAVNSPLIGAKMLATLPRLALR